MTRAMFHSGWIQLRQHSLVVALVLFFGAIYTQYALKIKHSDHGVRSAFLRWKTQLEDLDHGVNVWQKYA